MSKVKVAAFSVSLDGFGAGVEQSLKDPLGVRGEELHTWIVGTKTFNRMGGRDGGREGVDNDFAERSMENIGAWVMGRNMFGPVRGPWPDNEWRGWWGQKPPYHVPVFILTHHPRKSVDMEGDTTFHFVTGGLRSALEEAKKVANGKDIRIGGGVSTIRQCLQAGYIDEMHLAISPVFLGSGEHLFSGLDLTALGFNQVQKINGEDATHIILAKK
ncbi:dihydrofolate reductase family protein [Fulvivirgaceae bacterium PWU4]|uniref:Dihydrofolate reductase family protein n=1 Tax=Chryseosolibacter histidini TaxID=2782349 RepID=A0AAP2GI36_9BACT|nr:dihydrofolate reductase family protein [Chryseosolibacter histidini]MBT1696696.1 dihydrofolate reductase family protein [Chryseosolibacter histidini]